MADSTDDEIIELTQMVEDEIPEAGEILELTQMAEEEPLVLENMETADEAPVPDPANADDPPGLNPETISQAQLDAAVERVIEKKFAQRIEKILFEVTETVIKREIAEIKAGLQKDLDDIDNA